MRPSRVFRLLFRIFILVLSLSITIVAFLGGLSAVMILAGAEDNINVDIDNAIIQADFNETTYQIEDFNFSLPVAINNVGYFDLENLKISVSLEMNYSHVNLTAPGVNTTRQIEILRNEQNFPTIPKGQLGTFNFTADMGNFNSSALPDFETEVDLTRGPPAIIFYATLIISLDYSLGLHSVIIGITNLEIGEI